MQYLLCSRSWPFLWSHFNVQLLLTYLFGDKPQKWNNTNTNIKMHECHNDTNMNVKCNYIYMNTFHLMYFGLILRWTSWLSWWWAVQIQIYTNMKMHKYYKHKNVNMKIHKYNYNCSINTEHCILVSLWSAPADWVGDKLQWKRRHRESLMRQSSCCSAGCCNYFHL